MIATIPDAKVPMYVRYSTQLFDTVPRKKMKGKETIRQKRSDWWVVVAALARRRKQTDVLNFAHTQVKS